MSQASFSRRRGGVLFGRGASWPFWGILAFFGRLAGVCVGWVVIRRFVLSFVGVRAVVAGGLALRLGLGLGLGGLVGWVQRRELDVCASLAF